MYKNRWREGEGVNCSEKIRFTNEIYLIVLFTWDESCFFSQVDEVEGDPALNDISPAYILISENIKPYSLLGIIIY